MPLRYLFKRIALHYEAGYGFHVIQAEGGKGGFRVGRISVTNAMIEDHFLQSALVSRAPDAPDFDLVVAFALVAFDDHKIAGRQAWPEHHPTAARSSSSSSWISAQRLDETTATSEAPALRWRKESRPSWSMSKA